MTDGTSQGLFIVVAIVIFGIFVVLAYILFEDTLSPAMANMFNAAIEQSSDNLNNKNLIKFKDIHSVGLNETDIYEQNNMKRIIRLKGDEGRESIVLPITFFEQGKSYTFEFNMEVHSGSLEHFGGHQWYSDNSEVYVNGTRITETVRDHVPEHKHDWTRLIKYDFTPGNYQIKVVFDTNQYDWVMEHHSNGLAGNLHMYIQPNRNLEGVFDITLSNLHLYENK